MFDKGHVLWTPADAAPADAAIEQLCRNFHLHKDNSHVVCLSRLMTSRWRKQLLKVADLFVKVPFNDIVWPQCNHEPLILAVILSLHSSLPWKLKHTKFVTECKRKLQTAWKEDFSIGGHLLREL